MENSKLEADAVGCKNLLHKTSFAHAETYLDELKANKQRARYYKTSCAHARLIC